MKIAVYSGSFNPLHIGHLAIMEALVRSSLFDGVYLVVSPQNPFKDPSGAESGRRRYDAAVSALSRHPHLRGVTVDDIELSMPPPHYTIRTLDALRRRDPGNRFTLVVGADNLSEFRGWKDYSRILSEYGVAAFPRRGVDLAAVAKDLLSENDAFRINVLDMPLVDISSSFIRDGISKGKDMSGFLM